MLKLALYCSRAWKGAASWAFSEELADATADGIKRDAPENVKKLVKNIPE